MVFLRYAVLLVCTFSFSLQAVSQSSPSSRVWLMFADRGSMKTDLSSYTPASLGISERALWRRAKVLPANQLLDERDLPIAPEYLDAIRATGATIRATSRWFNAVSVEATAGQLTLLKQLPCITNTQPVAVSFKPKPELSYNAPFLPKQTTPTTLDYGTSLTQIQNINAVGLHDLGINGDGIIVGMVDDGYNNHRTHDAMKSIKVLAEYDFVHDDTNTSIEGNDSPGQGGHGAYTLSTLAGFKSGQLIGPGFGASLLLAKTEVDESETQVEEDYYVEGLEWLEANGADIISSSLGYIDWYTHANLDGKTAVTTKASRILAQKGILLVTAMGNEGHFQQSNPTSTGTLLAPADADSIISVGAIISNGIIASFSSTGPTGDGRIKPEVVAQGVMITAAIGSTTSLYAAVDGTSLSTPLTAGVAALVLSAHPQLTPMQLREALINTAQRISDGTRTDNWPNNYYGHGKVDAMTAALYYGFFFSNKPTVTPSGSSLTITTAIMPHPSAPLTSDSLFLYYRATPTSQFQRVALTATGQANMYSATIPAGSGTPEGYFSAKDNSGASRTSPYNAPYSVFVFNQNPVINGVDDAATAPETFVLEQNYPNPFNAGTIIRFHAPSAVPVELAIYNVLGQKIRTLYTGVAVQGVNQFFWDGTTEVATASSGIYFSRLSTPTVTLAEKMVFIR